MVTGDKWTRLYRYPPAQCGNHDRDKWNYTSEYTELRNDTLKNPILAPDNLWAEAGKYTRDEQTHEDYIYRGYPRLAPDNLWVVWADDVNCNPTKHGCNTLQPDKAWL